MQAKIENLKAKNSNDEEYIVYPRTLIKCVTNENGDNLQDLISDTILEADGRVYVDYGSHEETDEYVPVNADTLDGQEASYYATAKSVSDITDGTTVVKEATKATFDGQNNNISETYLPKTGTAADSAKLGGKSASEYATLIPPAENIPSGANLNTYTTAGEWAIPSATITTSLVNKPSGLTKGGRLIVQNAHNVGTLYQTILSSDGIFFRYCSGGTFGEWEETATTADLANYLPKTGGTVKGTNSVPLELQSGHINNGYCYLNLLNKDASFAGAFGVDNGFATFVDMVNGTKVFNKLLHTGNKPTGTYNGTGAARTVNTGGSFSVILIHGGGYCCIVDSNYGAIMWTASGTEVTHVPYSEISFVGSVLTINSGNAAFNASGQSYWYRIL